MTGTFRLLRRLSILSVVVLLALSGFSRLVSAGLAMREADAPAAGEAAADYLCHPSEEVELLVEQIGRRNQSLDAREEALALQEQDVAIAKQEIAASLDRLEAAEERLAARMATSRTASEEDIARLVNVYEGMKAKDAALLFETMAPVFASGFLSRMRPDAAAAIFSNLTPDTAYALSVMMAGRNANAATE
jgi:flagellar motility protein MotE (MotC chaperone)